MLIHKKRYLFTTVLFFFAVLVSGTKPEQYSQTKIPGNVNSTKERFNMANSYSRHLANNKRNSLVDESVSESIKKNVISTKIKRSSKDNATHLLILTTNHGLICTDEHLYLFSLINGTVLGGQTKFSKSPVIRGEQENVYYVNIALYNKTINNFNSRNFEPNGPMFSSDWATFDHLFTFKNFVISGITLQPFAKNNQRHTLIIACQSYTNGSKQIWSRTFDKPVPPPPVCNNNGDLIIYHNGSLLCISSIDGTTLKEKQINKKILECSVGPNNHLYTICTMDSTRYISEWDEDFNEISSGEIPSVNYFQPPVTLPDGNVLLVGSKLAAAYINGQQQWIVPQTGDEKSPFIATATANNRILLIDGRQLFCLDEKGKKLWGYSKEDQSPFQTQPVVGKDGLVYVADNDGLYVFH